jgi:hypothetical protein
MTIDSTDNDKGNSFEYRLKEVSDEEIVSILRYRDHYQPQAVKAAVREALKRGIIESIEDLEKDEFKSLPIPPKNLFPISLIKEQNESIFKSLCRICYVFGIFPLIYGIFQIADHRLLMGIVTITIGISIILITFKLEKEKKQFLSQLLLTFNVPAISFAIYRITTIITPSTMDLVVTAVIIIVLLYTTLYIYKLTMYLNRNK